MARLDAAGTSYEAFARTMRKHPDRLKGKTIDQAYQGMRRQVEHLANPAYRGQNKKTLGPVIPAYKGKTTGPKVPQAAVARKLSRNAAGVETRVVNGKKQIRGDGRSDWHYPVDANKGKITRAGLPNPLSPLQYKNGKTPYQRLRGNLGEMGNPLASKGGKTPLQRLGVGRPAAPKKYGTKKSFGL